MVKFVKVLSGITSNILNRLSIFLLIIGSIVGISASLNLLWTLTIGIVLFSIIIFLYFERKLALWQKIMMALLGGYIILNYGFTNIAIHVSKLIIPIGIFGAMFFFLNVRHSNTIQKFIKEKTFLFLIAWVIFSIIRLIYDFPRYGIYAIRDSSIVFEAVFVYFGYIFLYKKNREKSFIRLMAFIFILNLLNVLTYPWRVAIREISPQVTALKTVSLFGYHAASEIHLLAGGIFFLIVAKHYFRLPFWIFWAIASLNFAALGLLQMRGSYLSLVVIFITLSLLKKYRVVFSLTKIFALFLIILVLIPAFGIQIPGRHGDISSEFFVKHMLSVTKSSTFAGSGSAKDRIEWWSSTITDTLQGPTTAMVGQGFGMPLIDFTVHGAVIRQPHNSFISVFARTGLIGFSLWILFHISFIKTVLSKMNNQVVKTKDRDVLIWLFLYYVIFIITTNLQPTLEFSYGAVPFYFLVGLTLYLAKTAQRQSDTDDENPART